MNQKKVGVGRILLHIILIFLTGGLWLLWLIVRALLK